MTSTPITKIIMTTDGERVYTRWGVADNKSDAQLKKKQAKNKHKFVRNILTKRGDGKPVYVIWVRG